eukprot:gene1019-45_t
MSNKQRNPYLWQEVRKKDNRLNADDAAKAGGDGRAAGQFQYKDPVEKFQEVVEIPKQCVGLVFGKKRENLNKLETQFCVKIRVEEEREECVPLVISSALQSDLNFAVRELETVRQTLPITQAMIGYACGKQNSILKKMQDETEARPNSIVFVNKYSYRQIRIGRDDKVIEFVGSSASVQPPDPRGPQFMCRCTGSSAYERLTIPSRPFPATRPPAPI